jgi:hypothetical protein
MSSVEAKPEAPDVALPRCVALTQEHRGHGTSTAAYYLGRALVAQGLRVLLADLSQHQSPLMALVSHHPTRNLVPWTPAAIPPRQLSRLLASARLSTAGRADVILLDIDATLLVRGDALGDGVDYVAAMVESSLAGRGGTERLVARLAGERGLAAAKDRAGVVFTRVEPPSVESLPTRLDNGVPVLGWLPADYLLAAGEAYSVKGGTPATPHDVYLNAIKRLAQSLTRLVPLQRLGGTTQPHPRTA